MSMHPDLKAVALLLVLACSVTWAANNASPAATAIVMSPATAGLLQRAGEGDANAMNALGTLYLNGDGVPQSGAEAIRLFKKAVELGNADGAKNLGRAYFRGRGVQFNKRESIKWFRAESEMREGKSTLLTPIAEPTRPASAYRTRSIRPTCQVQVSPELPGVALRTGKGGKVRAEAMITGGKVRDVSILSGPVLFQEAVTAAMLQYQCDPTSADESASQEFVFSISDRTGRGFVYVVSWNDTKWTKVAEPAFNADWFGLTNAQRRVVRARYANLPASYEPPYPSNGLGALVEDIRVFAEHWNWTGKFSLEVSIDANGVATGVNVFESPTEKAREYAAAVAFNARYKPAMCEGNPCAMIFPIDIEIVRVDSDHPNEDSLEKRAAGDDAAAQNLMGERYEYARGVDKDFAIALGWYRRSAAKGFLDGLNNLARMLEAGRGTEKNYAEALVLYRAAAERGYAPSQNNYGYMLAHGRGTTINYPEAVKWFARSAAQGYALGQFNLAGAYLKGQGVSADIAMAAALYQRAMEDGNEPGGSTLVFLRMFGIGDTFDVSEALQELSADAFLGNAQAASLLGISHARGAGVAQSDQKAFQMFLQSAGSGNAGGQILLADSYEKGRGTPVDLTQARAWLEKAAAQTDPFAMMRLSEMYAQGRGTPKNPEMAQALELQAKEQNYTTEMDDIMQLVLFNRVVERDAMQSVVRYREASPADARLAWEKVSDHAWEANLPSTLSVVQSTPALAEPMPANATLTVTLKFDVVAFKDARFYVMPQFDSVTPGVTLGLKDPGRTRFPWLSTQSGATTVNIPLAEVLANPKIKQPLRVRFVLNRTTGPESSASVARTEAITLKLVSE